MSSDFNFTVASWFLGNVRVKPHSKHSVCVWGGGGSQKLLILRRHSLWTAPNCPCTYNGIYFQPNCSEFRISRFALGCSYWQLLTNYYWRLSEVFQEHCTGGLNFWPITLQCCLAVHFDWSNIHKAQCSSAPKNFHDLGLTKT